MTKEKYIVIFFSIFILIMFISIIIGNKLCTGDDPHYLVMTESFVKDGDWLLANNYQEKCYRKFYPFDKIEPHIYSKKFLPWHMIGLSILISPAYILGGRLGVLFFNNLIVSIIFILFLLILHRKEFDIFRSFFVTFGLFSIPFFFFNFSIYPELIVAFIIFIFYISFFELKKTYLIYFSLFFIGFLPWMHTKYIATLGICDLIFFIWLIKEKNFKKISISKTVVMFILQIALLVYFFIWNKKMGIPINREPGLIKFQFGEGILGLFFDKQFGLLPFAPIFIMLFPGILVLFRDYPIKGLAISLILFSIYFPAAFYKYWYGGLSLPARYLVPCIPIILIIISDFFSKIKNNLWYIYILLSLYTWAVLFKSLKHPGRIFSNYSTSEFTSNILKGLRFDYFFPSIIRSSLFDFVLMFFWLIIILYMSYSSLKFRIVSASISKDN